MGSKRNKRHHRNGHRFTFWKLKKKHKVKYTPHTSKHATTQQGQDLLISSTSTPIETDTPYSRPQSLKLSISQDCVTLNSTTTENHSETIRTPNSHPQSSNTNQASSTNTQPSNSGHTSVTQNSTTTENHGETIRTPNSHPQSSNTNQTSSTDSSNTQPSNSSSTCVTHDLPPTPNDTSNTTENQNVTIEGSRIINIEKLEKYINRQFMHQNAEGLCL
jgi:hypothetical protein